MKELEPIDKSKSAARRVVQSRSRPPKMEELEAVTTDKLVKLLLSAEITQPINNQIRQQIIKILKQREGNAFVQRILGKSPGK